jgi:LacI family transcriptional regulator
MSVKEPGPKSASARIAATISGPLDSAFAAAYPPDLSFPRRLVSKKKAPVTIHDIARDAGVSASTVSRVLTGSTPVAEQKREAVMKAVARLQYEPNLLARGLARGLSHAVGVLTQEINHEYHGDILMGIEVGLEGSGWHPVFASASVADEATQVQALVTSHRVDALVLVGGKMPEEQVLSFAEVVPVVVIGRLVRGLEERCIQVDNLDGALAATRHLITLGHRRIAHITGRIDHPHSVARLEGYRRAFAEAGLDVDPELIVEGDFEEPSGYRAVERLIERGLSFTAIFAASDLMALGARLALYRHGVAVPEQVSLIGFDDLRAATYSVPPLTTVRQPRMAMGRAAAQALLHVLEGKPLSLPAFQLEFVVRASTGPARPA